MASTYDPSLINTVEKDWVRFNIGDRGPTYGSRPFILDDSEITQTLAQERNKWIAAFRCGHIILARGFGITAKSVDGLSISWGDSAESNYRKHLQTLMEEGCRIQLTTNRVFTLLSVD